MCQGSHETKALVLLNFLRSSNGFARQKNKSNGRLSSWAIEIRVASWAIVGKRIDAQQRLFRIEAALADRPTNPLQFTNLVQLAVV